jgi:DNA-binding CsgD family transcriptional regulator
MPAMSVAARASNVGGARASAVRDAVEALAGQALHPAELLHEVQRRIAAVVPYDSGAWWTVDPESLLATELGESDQRFGSNTVFSSEDFDVFDHLDRSGRDARARPHALYVLSRSGGATWATARFARAPDRPVFTQVEANYLSSVARYIGAGIREYLSQIAWLPGHSVVPGVLIVDADEQIADATPDAVDWLTRLDVTEHGTLPPSLRGLVRQTREQRVGSAPLRPAKVRIRLPQGNWLVARAAKFTSDETQTAVLMKAATRADMRGLLLAVHGLTPRECEVTELLIAGADPQDVAGQLNLSVHTVRSHVKTIFAKVGVSSRAELTAALASR